MGEAVYPYALNIFAEEHTELQRMCFHHRYMNNGLSVMSDGYIFCCTRSHIMEV